MKEFTTRRKLLVGVLMAKKVIKTLLWTSFGLMLVVLLSNLVVVQSSQSKIFFDVKNIPSNDVGLVLGTNRFVAKGKENLFFKYRMEATARLYKEGKVKYLILSGNKEEFYDEPRDMKAALENMGVPENAMLLDTAGYRTFDSVTRCKKVYNQEKVTVISQNFHNSRALYLCEHEGIEAVGFAAQDVPDGYSARTLVREYLARPKAMIDVYFLD